MSKHKFTIQTITSCKFSYFKILTHTLMVYRHWPFSLLAKLAKQQWKFILRLLSIKKVLLKKAGLKKFEGRGILFFCLRFFGNYRGFLCWCFFHFFCNFSYYWYITFVHAGFTV